MQAKKLTYADYARIPDDGKRYEVLEGGLLVTPAPSPLHQQVSFRLQCRLADHFDADRRGLVLAAPIDVILSDHDILQPDLVVARPEQVSKRGIEGPPVLVVEILSPTTERRDRRAKARRYAALGVPHFWLVDPERRTLECFRNEGGGYSVAALSDWPGLDLDLDALWT